MLIHIIGYTLCAIFIIVIGATLFILGSMLFRKKRKPCKVVYESKREN
jgi:hypothetical protein